MELFKLTETILKSIPQIIMPTEHDMDVIKQHTVWLSEQEDALITGFYDVIFEDEHLKNYLQHENREQRTAILRQWYRITLKGEFDESYWAWQALIGVVHVKYGISNAAMLGMWGWIMCFLQRKIQEQLPLSEAIQLLNSFQKIQITVSSIIVESYIHTQREAIWRGAGLKTSVLNRFIELEIDKLLKQSRAAIHSRMAVQA